MASLHSRFHERESLHQCRCFHERDRFCECEEASMKTVVDEQFRLEATKFRLQFACPHCAYFDPEADACSEGYPTDEHRSPSLDRSALLFCKLFEGA